MKSLSASPNPLFAHFAKREARIKARAWSSGRRWSLRLLTAATLALPLLASSPAQAKDKDKSGEKEEKVPWYSKKVHLPTMGKTQMSVRTASYYQYFHSNYDNKDYNDQYSSLVNRISIGSNTRFSSKLRLGVGARIDTQNLWERKWKTREGHLCGNEKGIITPESRAKCKYGNDYRLERLSIELATRNFTATLGDFNVNLGRALGLSIRRLDQVGIDATIKGLQLRFKNSRVDVRALAGYANGQNSDFARRDLHPDPGYLASYCNQEGWNKADRYGNSLWSICSDFVVGDRIEVKKLPGNTRLGLYHTSIFFGGQGFDTPDKDDDSGERLSKRTHMAGMDITPGRIAKVWDPFFGGAFLMSSHPGNQNENFKEYKGGAFYTANTINAGQFSVLAEGKYYHNYLLGYSMDTGPGLLPYGEMATLERFDQQTPGGINSAGGRLRVDYMVGDTGLDLYLNGMSYAYTNNFNVPGQGMFSEEGGSMVYHGFGGFEYHKHHSELTFNMSGGYRMEIANKKTENRVHRKLPHIEFYSKIPLSKKGRFTHLLEFTGEARLETKGGKRFLRGLLIANYHMSPLLSFALFGGVTTEYDAASHHLALNKDRVCEKDGPSCQPHIWPGLEVQMNFWGSSLFKVFVGRRMGGLICVNGSCRVLPGFEGIESQLVLNF